MRTVALGIGGFGSGGIWIRAVSFFGIAGLAATGAAGSGFKGAVGFAITGGFGGGGGAAPSGLEVIGVGTNGFDGA
jgi:hypothetical protein